VIVIVLLVLALGVLNSLRACRLPGTCGGSTGRLSAWGRGGRGADGRAPL